MNPTKQLLLLNAFIVLLFSSCFKETAFFHSPLQGNSHAYHSIPTVSDSFHSATYLSGSFSAGSMNQSGRDDVYAFQAGIHRAHALGIVRLNYGASASAGSYKIKPYYSESFYNGYVDSSIYTGQRSFGSYGAFGGISIATPLHLKRGGEWRVIGVEGSLYREFGKYYDFRKTLPDSLAGEIDRKNYLGSLGINTELVFKARAGREYGVKIAVGSYLRELGYHEHNPSYINRRKSNDLLYFSATYHLAFKKNTIYCQANIATHTGFFQLGYNYRL